MRALLDRFGGLKRADGPGRANERVASPLLRGFHHLWVELQA